MTAPAMQLAEINGAKLELFDNGNQRGDPVMFIHGAGSIECHAILREPRMNEEFRLVHVHRRGYGRSERREGETTLAQEAADCRAALDHLGVERAHFVGESSGGVILLQYALAYPETVASLALLEPALPAVVHQSPELNAAQQRAGELFEAGDRVGAADAFYREICGSDYRELLDPNLPSGWLNQLADDMDAIVFQESPAMDAWQFTRDDAVRIARPVLNVVGGDSRPYFHDCHEIIASWIPHAENVVLPDTRHCILEMNSSGVAGHFADFFSRHRVDR